MGIIKLLDKSVAELVAAGEVVERPASVIKELLENSADSGASSITVEIKNGGLSYMRVTDDGCGISPEDMPVAFLRHATSKISSAGDLTAIGTLGFRGEALASICAVSRMEMISRTRNSQVGCRAVCNAGELAECYETGCPEGTTVLVRDLFFNVPARLKFMRRDVSEGNAVSAVVQRIALSRPDISVRFIRDNREVLYTSGNGRLYSAVFSVLGKEFATDLAQVEYEYSGIKVSGYVTKPYAAQGSRANQYFFLNGRTVVSRTCCAAIEQAFKNTISVGRFPGCVLCITMALDSVDVNIHPAKTEVRFVNEQPVFDAVYYGVKSAISGDSVPHYSGADFGKLSDAPATAVNIPLSDTNNSALPETGRREVGMPTSSGFAGQTAQSAVARRRPQQSSDIDISRPTETPEMSQNQEKASAEPIPAVASVPETVPASTPVQPPTAADTEPTSPREPDATLETPIEEDLEQLKVLGEVFAGYIVAECGSKMLVIDKHAAHERILFEQLREKIGNLDSQLLLAPKAVIMGGAERTAALSGIETLQSFGFAVEDFGGSLLLREVPTYVEENDAEPLLHELCERMADGAAGANTSMMDDLLHTAACKAAIKAGRSSDIRELESVVKTVLSDPRIRYCPHGRPVMSVMTKYELDKKFGRV